MQTSLKLTIQAGIVSGMALTVVLASFGAETAPSAPESASPDARIIFPNSTVNGQPARVMLDTGMETATFLNTGENRLGVKFVEPQSDVVSQYGKVAIGHSESVKITVGTQSFTGQFPVADISPQFAIIKGDFPGLAVGWPEIRDNILVFDSAKHEVHVADAVPAEVAEWQKFR